MTTNITAFYGDLPFKDGVLLAPADWSGINGVDGFTFQFRAVDVNTGSTPNAAGQVAAQLVAGPTTGPGRPGIGIRINAPKANEACQLVVMGQTKVMAGGAVVVGDRLMVDANGRFVTATAGKVVVGVASMAANQAGDLITASVNFLNFAAGA